MSQELKPCPFCGWKSPVAIAQEGGLEPLGMQFGVSKRCAGRVINREVYQDVL